MICQFAELRNKEVININTGIKLGYVDDIEINTENASIINMIVYGRPKFFGLFGHEDDLLISFDNIQLIGEDTILVSFQNSTICTKTKGIKVENLFK